MSMKKSTFNNIFGLILNISNALLLMSDIFSFCLRTYIVHKKIRKRIPIREKYIIVLHAFFYIKAHINIAAHKKNLYTFSK